MGENQNSGYTLVPVIFGRQLRLSLNHKKKKGGFPREEIHFGGGGGGFSGGGKKKIQKIKDEV